MLELLCYWEKKQLLQPELQPGQTVSRVGEPNDQIADT